MYMNTHIHSHCELRGDAAERAQGRGKVDMGGEGVGFGAGLGHARHPHDQRHPDHLFADARQFCPEAVAAAGIVVVGGAGDEDVVVDAELVEHVEDAPQVPVELGEHGDACV